MSFYKVKIPFFFAELEIEKLKDAYSYLNFYFTYLLSCTESAPFYKAGLMGRKSMRIRK